MSKKKMVCFIIIAAVVFLGLLVCFIFLNKKMTGHEV